VKIVGVALVNSKLRRLVSLFPPFGRHLEYVSSTAARVADLEKTLNAFKSQGLFSPSPGLSSCAEDLLTERLMAHPTTTPLPEARLASAPALDLPDRVAVAERLLAAYLSALEAEGSSPMIRDGEDIWTSIMRHDLPELFSSIEKQDAASLADFLMHFGSERVWYGGITTCVDGYNKNLDPYHIALTYLDKLLCLAEALGVVELEHPEAGPWGESLHSDIDELLHKIEDHLQISITPPQGAIHTDGLKTGRGLFHYRHLNSLYAATRIQRLNSDLAPVCEIGGGLGITALYARRLGVRDYTMLDLPITCLLAGHYLLHSLRQDEVSLFGEPLLEDTIKLLPYWEYPKIENDKFSLTINQDSLTEIADNLVMSFLCDIKRTSRDYFLSINHEYHKGKVVKDFVRRSGGFHEIHRSKYWIREGYVEELYKPEKS
jgi:hypothetical protein